jgi:hypothetical protein
VSKGIPALARTLVRARDAGGCSRCGGKGAEWHHRRSRSVHDQHRDCVCNGLWLCHTCHKWVTEHPFEAKAAGLIVSRHQPEPGSVVVQTVYGTRRLLCEGGDYELVPMVTD